MKVAITDAPHLGCVFSGYFLLMGSCSCPCKAGNNYGATAVLSSVSAFSAGRSESPSHAVGRRCANSPGCRGREGGQGGSVLERVWAWGSYTAGLSGPCLLCILACDIGQGICLCVNLLLSRVGGQCAVEVTVGALWGVCSLVVYKVGHCYHRAQMGALGLPQLFMQLGLQAEAFSTPGVWGLILWD